MGGRGGGGRGGGGGHGAPDHISVWSLLLDVHRGAEAAQASFDLLIATAYVCL